MSSKKAQQTIEAAKKEEQKKKKSSSSSDSDSSDDSSSSEDKPKTVAKKEEVKSTETKKPDTKKPDTKGDTKKKASSSSSDSDSDSDSSSEDKKPKTAAKKEETKKVEEPKKEVKKEEPKKSEKKASSSSSDSDSDSDSSSEDKKPAAKKVETPAKKEETKKVEEPKKETKKEEPKKSEKKESSSSDDSDSDSDSSSEEDKKPSEDKKRKAAEIEAQVPPSKKQKTENGGVPTGSTSVAEVAEEDKNITKIFVNNLSFKVTEDNCHELFKDIGKIISFDWWNNADGRFAGKGVLEFATPDEAQKALTLNGTMLLGRDLVITLNRPRPQRDNNRGGRGGRQQGGNRGVSPKPEGCNTIFLGNLANDIAEEDVRGAFGDCGEIAAIRWVERDGNFTGIAFVQFTATEATDKAIELNGTMLKGRAARVDFAKSQSRKEY